MQLQLRYCCVESRYLSAITDKETIIWADRVLIHRESL